MKAVDLIARKQVNGTLTPDEIRFLVQGYTHEEIPDHQMADLLRAIVSHGLSDYELDALTEAMVGSGVTLNLRGLGLTAVDFHSTGGVGDKTTLVLTPMLAAIGAPVGKMCGRSLGFTGGTIDKLESFTDFRSDLSQEEFVANLRQHGIAIAEQTTDLVPADGRIYALRNRTSTVESIPLIASSIMSKKLAVGAQAVMLDVKTGQGAFMDDLVKAEELANTMIRIGRQAGIKVGVVISDMSQPLGQAIGNSLEVKEAIRALQGNGPDDVVELCLTLGTHLVYLAGIERDTTKIRSQLLESMRNGKALAKLAELVSSQGGREEEVYDPSLLPSAPVIRMLCSPYRSYLAGIDSKSLGMAVGQLATKRGFMDHAVGMVLKAKLGDWLFPGAELLEVHARSEADIDDMEELLLDAFEFGDETGGEPPLIYRIIT